MFVELAKHAITVAPEEPQISGIIIRETRIAEAFRLEIIQIVVQFFKILAFLKNRTCKDIDAIFLVKSGPSEKGSLAGVLCGLIDHFLGKGAGNREWRELLGLKI